MDVKIKRDLLVEYLVNTSESWSRSHSIGIDFSAIEMLGMNGLPSFGAPLSVNNLRQFGATLSTPPSVRNEHIESTHQTYSDAGIKTSGKVNVLGKTTELKPELKNEDKVKVFDSSIINVIGENLTAASQLKEAMHPETKAIAIDEPIESEVIEEDLSVTPESKIKVEIKQEPQQNEEENRIVSLGVEAVIDDLSTPINIDNLSFLSQVYFENTNENQPVKRSSSPEPVDTEMRKKEKVAANTMREISDKWQELKPHTGHYTKAVAEVGNIVSKGLEPINEFIIEPALKYLNTGIRRGLRDGCGVSQGLAQDIGDITSFTAGLIIPGTTAKVISKGGKLVGFGKAAVELQKFDKVTKVPYNPRAFETLLQQNFGVEKVASSTMPKANAKNVKLAGQGKVFTVGSDELTGKPIVKHIPINDRGLPVFDDIAAVDLMIPENIAKIKNRNKHFKSATIELKRLIDNGIINKNIFNAAQMNAISNEAIRIPGFTWHHHENFRRLQLVPREIHEKTGHFGGFDLWFK